MEELRYWPRHVVCIHPVYYIRRALHCVWTVVSFPIWFRLDVKSVCWDSIIHFVGFSMKWGRNSKHCLSNNSSSLCYISLYTMTYWANKQTLWSAYATPLMNLNLTVFFTCPSSVMHSCSPQLLTVLYQRFIQVHFLIAFKSQTNQSLSRLFFHSKICPAYISAVILFQFLAGYRSVSWYQA